LRSACDMFGGPGLPAQPRASRSLRSAPAPHSSVGKSAKQAAAAAADRALHYTVTLCLSVCLGARTHALMSSRRPADADRPRRETANAEAKRQVQFFLTEVQPVLLNSKQKKRIKEFAQYFKEAQPLLGDGDVRLLLWGDAAVCVCVCARGGESQRLKVCESVTDMFASHFIACVKRIIKPSCFYLSIVCPLFVLVLIHRRACLSSLSISCGRFLVFAMESPLTHSPVPLLTVVWSSISLTFAAQGSAANVRQRRLEGSHHAAAEGVGRNGASARRQAAARRRVQSGQCEVCALCIFVFCPSSL
jgi:hypothetical protein